MDNNLSTLWTTGQDFKIKEEQFSVDKVPTHGKYLIENDSIGPPATQKIP